MALKPYPKNITKDTVVEAVNNIARTRHDDDKIISQLTILRDSIVNNGDAWTPATNVISTRSFDANTVTLAQLADVVGTLQADLTAKGIL
ncbi:MAG TPA: hypothetical protein VLA40_11025 [Rheinheimera sp.]|nr:hypothetical protein [Rheinheimera sp.]